MSLTAEAYRERKWGPFPALRKALQDKQVPSDYYGLTLSDYDMFDRLHRLTEIAVLAGAYESDIKETAVSMGREEMYRDLCKLEEALDQASYFFTRSRDKVPMLNATL
jgi:hypothetical protein